VGKIKLSSTDISCQQFTPVCRKFQLQFFLPPYLNFCACSNQLVVLCLCWIN